MKYGRVITAAVCAAVLLAALCGCGDTPQEVSAPTTTASTTTTTAAEETTTTTAETTADTTTATTPKTTTKKLTTTTSTKKPTTTTTKPTTTTTKYVPEIKNLVTLSAKQEAEIKDYWVSRYVDPEPQHTADAVEIIYYGTYNGYVALTIVDNYWCYPAVCWDDNVGGYLLKDLTGFGVRLWKDGEIIDLQAAYDRELITNYDCRDIAYYYRCEELNIRTDQLVWYPRKSVNTQSAGNAIRFTEGIELNFYIPGEDFEIMIIQSEEQLQLLCENPVTLPADPLPSRYNETYFRDGALVVIMLHRSGYYPKVSVTDLRVNNYTLGITLLEDVPKFENGTPLPDAFFPKYITLEVKKEDIKDVAAIEYFLTYTK